MSNELQAQLDELIGKITGSYKDKESGSYVTLVRGRTNKNYGHAEINICIDDLQKAVQDGVYSWQSKDGKTWVPVRLKVWANNTQATNSVKAQPAVPSDPIDDSTIPF